MQIDAHVHFWKYNRTRDGWITNDMKLLQQDYLPAQLQTTLRRNNIDGCVAIQADQSEVESLFLMELAKTTSIIKAVVGWADLHAPNIAERLDYFSEFSIIKGFRHIVQGEASGFLAGTEFKQGMRLLKDHQYTYDILVYDHQLNEANDFVAGFPNQVFILDHCGKPAVRNGNIDAWKKSIVALSKHENLYCKLSGLFTEAKWGKWSAADFYPYFDVLFQAFGSDRLMFASDWPVMLLSGIYVQWKSLIEKYMEQFTNEDREKVFGLNCARVYRI